MTPQLDYIENRGIYCPRCDSDEHTSQGPITSYYHGYALQDRYCLHCQAYWTDKYALIEYTKLERDL